MFRTKSGYFKELFFVFSLSLFTSQIPVYFVNQLSLSCFLFELYVEFKLMKTEKQMRTKPRLKRIVSNSFAKIKYLSAFKSTLVDHEHKIELLSIFFSNFYNLFKCRSLFFFLLYVHMILVTNSLNNIYNICIYIHDPYIYYLQSYYEYILVIYDKLFMFMFLKLFKFVEDSLFDLQLNLKHY